MERKEWVQLYGILPSPGDGPYRIPVDGLWVGKHACTLSASAPLLSNSDGELWASILWFPSLNPVTYVEKKYNKPNSDLDPTYQTVAGEAKSIWDLWPEMERLATDDRRCLESSLASVDH